MRKTKQAKEIVPNELTLLDYQSSDYINQSSLEYALSTFDRSLPGIDGFKNSQRKAIFTLSKISGEIKTVSCAGRMISDGIYLHGDASASGTLQNLASPVVNNYPLIGKRGGFGTQVNPTPASPRYTYVKKTKITEALVLRDLDVVPMQENYDGTTMEPKFFLPLIPLALLGVDGTATAYKSFIFPYRMNDIIDNTIRAIEGKELLPMTPYYASYGANDYVEDRGEGKYTFFGKAEVIDASTVRITGLAPRMKLEKFVEDLIEMEDSGKIRSYEDNSSGKVDITIKLPRGLSGSWQEMDVLEYFSISTKLAHTLNVLGENGKVKSYDDVQGIIRDFVQFRFKYYIKRYEKLLSDADAEVRYKILVKECFDNDMMAKIKSFKNRAEVVDFVTALNDEIQASDDNIQNIVNFPSYRWTQENYDKVLQDIEDALAKMDEYNDLLANHDKIWNIYKQELVELKNMNFTLPEED
ncbi:DNA topoisomerase II [Cronobacter phage vB_CsaM_GAP32]|uniref:DNA topoisomerase (ATP-hydrolyzing) n=1 Tax=Cronobacter phage vB_CsaM_GAP32 TaxID=1141136 RepID=K4F9M4_9CAUD|nr:DNA topoisomerase II [Cronobacter phage vB_CsaM_GAP32]AFC21770.1 DNA topoisomerase II [Cronobacter phage vB_CsaM_GAP32]